MLSNHYNMTTTQLQAAGCLNIKLFGQTLIPHRHYKTQMLIIAVSLSAVNISNVIPKKKNNAAQYPISCGSQYVM